MKKVWKIGKLCVMARGCALATVFLGLAALAPARAAGENGAKTIQALFVSDIHFEPFLDPEKAVKLATAPVGEWNAILAAPASADAAARWAKVEQACPTRGADTSFALYQSSLRAIHVQAGDAKFVIVSGDLIAHSFSCKFAAVFPKAAPADLRAFVGNNDSDCGDYQLDANSAFLKESAENFAADLRGPEQAQARETFAAGGYYSVSLPAPLRKARLLVLDDLFMSEKYQTCGGKADAAPAAQQIAWLKQQLDAAREKKEKVWVMAHIPPGVDSYSTARKWQALCAGGQPKMFLASEALPETLAEYGDVVPLAIFAHTHMDEVRLLEPGPGNERMAERGIAVKLVASISPIDGNLPSFTLASIDAGTAVMKDYRVIAASNATGVDTKWAEEYDFAKTYKEDGFTAIGVRDVIAGFGADPGARQTASQSYLRYYMTGVDMRMMALIWQPYVCSLTNDTTDAYRECVCRSAP